MLLEEGPGAADGIFHEAARRWGKGFLISDRGSRRFDTPSVVTETDAGVDTVYRLGDLELSVTRRVAAAWTETYTLRAVGGRSVSIGSFAVSTPWRDVYFSAADSLRRGVHAHVWAGGADSWVWAVPMDGSTPGLGLVVTEGELWAYSVESRNTETSSNVRGHLYLHVTDASRAPHTLGGQPELVLEPGEEYRLSWRLAWYEDLDRFHANREPMLRPDRVSVEVGESIDLRAGAQVTLSTPSPLVYKEPGVHYVDATAAGRRSRVALFAHPPLKTIVEARMRFVLDHQRPRERADSRRAAFVPYDNDTGLTVIAGSWDDWSDARERVGTALLLQEARDRGWGDRAELDQALDQYTAFVDEHVINTDGTVQGDRDGRRPPRLYDFPWYARFLLGQDQLDRAVSVVDRYYALGGQDFLAFDLGPLLLTMSSRLAARRRIGEADRLRDYLRRHAAAVLSAGEELPAHEVNYEQSMVAPMLELLLAAHTLDPAAVPATELRRRLRWLTAFAADQPDARLRHNPIRHWDGYWFGKLRLWGDTFPHYWSVLSAAVYLAWPPHLAPATQIADLRQAGEAILQSNLSAFQADGSASCAFVYPSCVDGRPAHVADPLANDQDWALVYAMRAAAAAT